MNYLKINQEIENLDLTWQEYDFGDTLYTKVSTILLSQRTNITNDCETEKYKIQFCQDGYALIFREIEQASLVEKTIRDLSKIYLSFKRDRSLGKVNQKVANRSIVDADL